MSRYIIALALVSAGALAGYLFKDSTPAPPPAIPVAGPETADRGANPFDSDRSGDELAYLRSMLNEEAAARRRLEQTVESLGEQVALLAARERVRPSAAASAEPVTPPTGMNTPEPVLDEQGALMNAGLDTAALDQIQRRLEQAEMERLYLRNRAVREGWMGTERYVEESRALASRTDILRAELGETAYDRFLYETGRNNRVVVQSVLDGSPAAQAGIRVGDVILRYDDKPVFVWKDLTDATTEGEAGQTIRAHIQRQNSTIDIYLPRGPLGVRLGGAQEAP